MRSVLEIQHGGDAGALVGVGFLEGDGVLQTLPLLSPADLLKSATFQVIEMPHPESARFAVLNPQRHAQQVTVDLLEAKSGQIVARQQLKLRPGAVSSYEIAELFPAAKRDSGDVRLALEGTDPFQVSGYYTLPSGASVDLVFCPEEDAHPNGSYPLLSSTDFEVYTTLINLDQDPVTIGVQVSWPGGDYTVGPLEIPGNGSFRLEIEQLAEENEADLLGRRLDPEYEQAYLRWTTLRGAGLLIARTETKKRDGSESFGFNCGACCEEIPTTHSVPRTGWIGPGQTLPFQASVTIETCSGTTGPFPTDPFWISSPSPFNWNGTNVSASSGADRDLPFDSYELTVGDSCVPKPVRTRGNARAKACKKFCNPQCYSTSGSTTCAAQTPSCNTCYFCCRDLYFESICKGQNSGAGDGYLACTTNCVIDKGCSNPPSLPSFIPCIDQT